MDTTYAGPTPPEPAQHFCSMIRPGYSSGYRGKGKYQCTGGALKSMTHHESSFSDHALPMTKTGGELHLDYYFSE